jgi:phenylacetate-CoA ligase
MKKTNLSGLYSKFQRRLIYYREYPKIMQFLEDSQYADEQTKLDYQMKRLQETCQYAYKNIPYYKTVFDDAGFDADKLRYFDELEKVPFLTKEIIQKNTADMVSPILPKWAIEYCTTSGSTGTPLGLYRNLLMSVKERAFIDHMWKRVGYEPGGRMAVLRGTFTGERHFIAHERGKLMLSCYHMTDENLLQYIEALRAFQPSYIHGFPSAIYILADYMNRNNIEPIPSIKAILAASENIYSYQQILVEKIFACRVFSHYGHTEQAFLAAFCEKGNDYHIFWQYGYTELLDNKGKSVSKDGEAGEIVATSFNNFAMPLIRYKTMDIAENTLRTCSCGRNYKLISSIKGRLQEVLITTSGRYIPMVLICTIHSDIMDKLYQFQFYQDDPAFCIFYAVKRAGFTESDGKKIYAELKNKIGYDIELRIKYVTEIPRTKSGKYQFLVQKLPVLFIEGVYNE